MTKKMILCMSLAIALPLVFFSCAIAGPKTGDLKGVKIFVTRGPDDVTRGTRAATESSRYVTGPPEQSADYYQPKDIRIAFNKIWFPDSSAYDQIVAESTNIRSADDSCMYITDPSTLPASGYFKPLDGFTEITASSSTPYTPSSLPTYGETYLGALIDIVYYEFVMEDFSLRWYAQDHGDYLAKDVLLNGSATGGAWKFPYYYRTSTGGLTFVIEDERKSVLAGEYMKEYLGGGANTAEGYFCITTDGRQDDSNPGVSNEGIQDGWGMMGKMVLVAGHPTPSNPDPLATPFESHIFPEEENEAQYYLFQVSLNTDSDFSVNRYNGFSISPGIQADQTEHDTLTYAAFIHIIETNLTDFAEEVRDPLDSYPDEAKPIYTSVGPVGAGIDTRFGWIDFENNPQGEFSPGAGW
jgi:hypothetical protein